MDQELNLCVWELQEGCLELKLGDKVKEKS